MFCVKLRGSVFIVSGSARFSSTGLAATCSSFNSSTSCAAAAMFRAYTEAVGEAGYVTLLTSRSLPTLVMVRVLRSSLHVSASIEKANELCDISPRLISL